MRIFSTVKIVPIFVLFSWAWLHTAAATALHRKIILKHPVTPSIINVQGASGQQLCTRTSWLLSVQHQMTHAVLWVRIRMDLHRFVRIRMRNTGTWMWIRIRI